MSNRFEDPSINSETDEYQRNTAAGTQAPRAKGLFWRWLSNGRRLPPGLALLAMVATASVLWVAVIHLFRLLSR